MTTVATHDLAEIVEIFEFLDSWDARYQHLIEWGETLAAFPDRMRVPENKVKGCMSEVYLAPYTDPEDPTQINYYGECDTATIRGVVAILVNLLSHHTPQEIAEFDVDDFFEQLKLAEHLSPNRHFGIYSIVELMKEQAAGDPVPMKI